MWNSSYKSGLFFKAYSSGTGSITSVSYTHLCEVVEPDEQDWSSVLDCLLKTMENTSLAPSVIRVRDEDLYGILNSFGDVMGFRVHRAVSMPLMDSFIGEIIESLRNDG